MKPRTALLVTLSLFALLACSPKNQTFRETPRTQYHGGDSNRENKAPSAIVGGEIPGPQDIVSKYTVAVVDIETLELCSGTIVGKRTVVTAAHCIKSDYGALVLFGANARKPHKIISPAEVRLFPGYDQRKNQQRRTSKDWGDVAVIQLKEDIPSSYRIAKIAPKELTLRNGDRLLLAGYGAIDDNDDDNSQTGFLRKVNVNVLMSQWGHSEFVLNQKNGTGSCFGDSGGPAFYYKNAEYFLIGITSRAGQYFFDRCGGSSIYTHAGYYRDFILKNLN